MLQPLHAAPSAWRDASSSLHIVVLLILRVLASPSQGGVSWASAQVKRSMCLLLISCLHVLFDSFIVLTTTRKCFVFCLSFPLCFIIREAWIGAFLTHCFVFSTQERTGQMVRTRLILAEWTDGWIPRHSSLICPELGKRTKSFRLGQFPLWPVCQGTLGHSEK